MDKNTLYYGDNLLVLREHIPDNSVDLIYLDPPFNSSRTYNVLFKEESGLDAEAQVAAFEDTWHWNQVTQATYHELVTLAPERLGQMVGALYTAVGPNQMMAYLVMMAARLLELHRTLKPTGSLYLHCDPTASHYLKIILDTIFGSERFLSEIVWKRTSAHSSAKRPGPVHDVILLYSKSDAYVWNQQYQVYDETYIKTSFCNIDPDGRLWKSSDLTGSGVRRGETGNIWREVDVTSKGRHWMYPPSVLDEMDSQGKIHWPQKIGGMPRLKQYLEEMPGLSLQDIWMDVPPIGAQAAERLGYPTQKPISLLERIVQASSNPGDVVLDPFCGCGTAVAAAQKLDRRWIGIDITHLAIALQKYRLQQMFPGIVFDVVGEPTTLNAARQLAQDDRHQFEWWALSLIKARPVGAQGSSKQGKKGADQGIDGVMSFIDDASNKPKRALVQVKSGKVSSAQVRDLVGTVQREKAAMGVLITLEEPTAPMLKEAATAGFYQSPGFNRAYPAIQIFTIKQLLAGTAVDMPASNVTFKQAGKVKDGAEQLILLK